ncbi:MAG: hypothetical protein JXR46_01040 [Calditrichaceae bacterium]|nr:hypothetical protein [Calditrichaceae bacterium]MBN2707601.1 hypothetical protein [Calditrichaceae bacterium]RQV93222.1 MAG: hypothetical protein EH224_13095 [Calditrichota bacterium]
MPLTFTVNHKPGYVLCRYSGKITDEEIFNSWKSFYESDNWIPGMNFLSDISDVDGSAISSDGLRRLAQYSRTVHEKNNVSAVKVAIYASRPLPFGLARMYEGYSYRSPEMVRVFKSKVAAEAWLKGLINNE